MKAETPTFTENDADFLPPSSGRYPASLGDVLPFKSKRRNTLPPAGGGETSYIVEALPFCLPDEKMEPTRLHSTSSITSPSLPKVILNPPPPFFPFEKNADEQPRVKESDFMKPEKLVPIAATTFSASNQSDSPRLKIEEYALLAAQLYSQPERSIELQSHYQMDAGSFLSEKKAWEKIFSKDTSLFAKYGTLYQRYCDWMKKK